MWNRLRSRPDHRPPPQLSQKYGMNGYFFIRKLRPVTACMGRWGAAAMMRRAEISYSCPHTNQTMSHPSPPGSQVIER